MNGDEFSDATSHLPGADADRMPDVTMPLGTGEGPEEGAALDPLAGAGTRRKISGGSVLIAAVVIIATGGLFAMRWLSEATAARDADREIESTIESFLKSFTGLSDDNPEETETPTGDNPSDRVLAVLTTEYSERQVPLRDVQRNPFILSLIHI